MAENQFISNQNFGGSSLSTLSSAGGGGGSSGGGGGYMQGIASIGNALNNTHSNVLTTVDYFRKWWGNKEKKDERRLREQAMQANAAGIRNAQLQGDIMEQQKIENQRGIDWFRGIRDYFLTRR